MILDESYNARGLMKMGARQAGAGCFTAARLAGKKHVSVLHNSYPFQPCFCLLLPFELL